jgi:RNA polymerase sigma-70 factor (ECF subfamily)
MSISPSLLSGHLDPSPAPGFRNLAAAERVKGTVTDAERFVDEHYVEVYRLALRLLRDREGAIDLTQDVFYRALRALPRFRGDSTPRTWLYRITLNEARRRRPRAPTVGLEAAAERADPSAVTAESALADLDAARLHALITGLPVHEREAIVLHYLQGLTVTETAAALGALENTVKTWLFRGRARLRERWGPER